MWFISLQNYYLSYGYKVSDLTNLQNNVIVDTKVVRCVFSVGIWKSVIFYFTCKNNFKLAKKLENFLHMEIFWFIIILYLDIYLIFREAYI